MTATIYRELRQALAARHDLALVTPLPPPGSGGTAGTARELAPPVLIPSLPTPGAGGDAPAAAALPDRVAAAARQGLAQGRSQVVTTGEKEWLVEVYLAPPRLVIFGAGHIGQALARLGEALAYRILLYDDRPQYASPTRAPAGAEVLCRPFTAASRWLTLGRHDHVVIVTRGHQHDTAVLEQVVEAPVAYLGMIGSNRRVAAVRQALARNGVDPERLARIFAPIGLDVGAETPQEIALAILAEITLVRRGGSGLPLRQARRRGVPPLVAAIHERAPVPDLTAERAGRSRRPTGSQGEAQSFAAVSEEADGRQLLERLLTALDRAEPAAVCTVIGTRGSTPRRAGAKMVVLRDGRCFGTVGGGCGEAEVRQAALTALDTGAWRRHWLDLTEDFARAEREVCGGFMDVFIAPVFPEGARAEAGASQPAPASLSEAAAEASGG